MGSLISTVFVNVASGVGILISTIIVNIVSGVVVITGRGLWLLPIIGYRGIGIRAGSLAALAQSFYGNLVTSSLISRATSLAMRFLMRP